MVAAKLWSVLSARMAIPFELLELGEEVLDQLVPFVEVGVAGQRGGAPWVWAITTLAPHWPRSAMMALLLKALSAIRPPNANLSISGGTPMVSKRWPGSGLALSPPFAPCPCDGGVDHGVLHVRCVRAGFEKPLEDRTRRRSDRAHFHGGAPGPGAATSASWSSRRRGRTPRGLIGLRHGGRCRQHQNARDNRQS